MNIYATDKILRHPKAVDAFVRRQSHLLNPITVHLMPHNSCNQNCTFCAYRMEGSRNAEGFNPKASIPWENMVGLLDEFAELGVKALEITGGGEPLLYPDVHDLFRACAEVGFDTALVTNGTLLTPELADALFATRLKWARVSIDAGTPDAYKTIRRCPEIHWKRAWEAVRLLSDRRKDHVIGVGFVATPVSAPTVCEFITRAADSGADNVRLSVAFTPAGSGLLSMQQAADLRVGIERSRHLESEKFHIHDLTAERIQNLHAIQNYDYCGIKDVLCVVEGSGNVYTCCSLTGNKRGLVGNFLGEGFASLWERTREWRRNFVPEKTCNCPCLYESRNQIMLALRREAAHANYL